MSRFLGFNSEICRNGLTLATRRKGAIMLRLAYCAGRAITDRQLKEIETLVEDQRDELASAWKQHFGS